MLDCVWVAVFGLPGCLVPAMDMLCASLQHLISIFFVLDVFCLFVSVLGCGLIVCDLVVVRISVVLLFVSWFVQLPCSRLFFLFMLRV